MICAVVFYRYDKRIRNSAFNSKLLSFLKHCIVQIKQMYVHLTGNPHWIVFIDTIYILLFYCIQAHTSTVTMFIKKNLRKSPGCHDIPMSI